MEKLKRYQDELESKGAESAHLKKKFKVGRQQTQQHFSCNSIVDFVIQFATLTVQIDAQILDTEVNFTGQEKDENEDSGLQIKGVFTISQRPVVLLQGGQALITFEEEKGEVLRCTATQL